MLESLWITISTYSILPAPQAEWRDENMKTAICFLPVVGVFIGAALVVWQRLCLALNAGSVIFAAISSVLPLFLTGGIHMDGFMDTVDALSSHQSKERKLEIMKDSHTGAFAVMWCAAYLLLNFGIYHALYQQTALWAAGVIFILSRALCAAGALAFPDARRGSSGILSAFTEHVKSRRPAIASLCILSLLCGTGMCLIGLRSGIAGVLTALAAFLIYWRVVIKEFGGITGDTCGFFIEFCEFLALFGLWLGDRL
ncbi:MAG: adenosylcobinamide-GDP ribazoletransferase [Clostridiales bacterium]|jgi:adenosylcobinamide-GDP ribazoletransferase|nr:adenosylcobinamide-GDP ribazoletransferase [Clostridiales bacterium]